MPIRSVLTRYAIVAAITMIALMMIGYLLETLIGFSIGSGTAIVSAMVPATDAGQSHARTLKAMPEKGYMWKMSAIFVGINFAIGLVFAGIILALLGGVVDMVSVLAALGAGAWALILVIVFGVYWLSGRFFFGFGAKNELKLQEKLAAKNARPHKP